MHRPPGPSRSRNLCKSRPVDVGPMEQRNRSCPLCGQTLAPGAPNQVLERHFLQCSKTDDRAAPRREWDGPSAS